MYLLLAGCSDRGPIDHSSSRAVAVPFSPPPAAPIAGVCSDCEGSLRKVPVLVGQQSATVEELVRAGEALPASSMGTKGDVLEVLICDACRTRRVLTGNPGEALPSQFGSRRPGEERVDNGLEMKFCWCPPGSFWMGSAPGEPSRAENQNPIRVVLSRGFWMGKFEVTQSQWRKVMGLNLREQRTRDPDQPRPVGDGTIRDHVGEGPDHPIYFVSQTEAEQFCRRLTKSEHAAKRLDASWKYLLPTEAQWEYACRAGTRTATPCGDRLASTEANFDGTHPYNRAPLGPYLRETTPVGRYPANSWGLHDMLGNVWEWCRDGYAPRLAGGVDPLGPSPASAGVFRGGCWHDFGSNLRAGGPRHSGHPETQRGSGLGFRVALVRTES